MREKQPGQAESEETSRVEHLLGVLRDLSQQEPSTGLRARLSDLSSRRLQRAADTHGTHLPWLRPIFVVALLVATGLTTGLVIHLWQREPLRAANDSRSHSAETPPSKETPTRTVSLPETPFARLPKTTDQRPKSVPIAGSHRMYLQLPYSNSTIVTGTDATIRVSMSQSELQSLGFPINTPLHDRRVVAELTLGDDGLPRAISLPLPLEVLKEKK